MAKLPTLDDLANVPRGDLLKLRDDVNEALRMNEAKARQEAKDKVRELIASSGFEFADLFGDMLPQPPQGGSRRGRKPKGESSAGSEGQSDRAPVAPKYRHPENPSETWSGRGRKPKWVEAHLEAGGNMEDLLINKQD